MPTVLNIKGYRFFFFSLEGNEPPHIHIEHGDKVGKKWTPKMRQWCRIETIVQGVNKWLKNHLVQSSKQRLQLRH